MTMLVAVAVLFWLATAYRVWVTATRPAALWRIYSLAGMAGVSLSYTLWLAAGAIDRAVGWWGLGDLIHRVVLVGAIACTLIFLESVHRESTATVHIVRQLAAAFAVCAVLGIAWSLAPVHARHYDDLVPLSGNLPVAIYLLAFWIYLFTAQLEAAWLCLVRRASHRHDPGGNVSLVLVGVACLLGLPVLMLWMLAVGWQRAGADPSRLQHVADRLLPVAPLCLTVGVLSLVVLPWLTTMGRTGWHVIRLRPLWKAMVRHHPEIRLRARMPGGPLVQLRTAETRALVEIHDALRLHLIDDSTAPTPCDLASALRSGRTGGLRAAALLQPAPTREADLQQMMVLAKAYRSIRP